MRLFVAIALGASIERAVEDAIGRVRARAPQAKWVHVDGAHVTLAFLGHRAEADVPTLEALVGQVARRHRPMTLGLSTAGTFGTAKRPRVLWLGVAGEVDALGELRSDIEGSLEPLGYEREDRPFAPHLTLARARDPRGDRSLAACRELLEQERAPAPTRVDAVTLFRSDLSPRGARYTALFSAALGAA